MKTYNVHEAKTNLSRLLELAEKGEPFIIARAGKPVVKVERIEARPPRRIGFLAGQAKIPDDFDAIHAAEIEALFGARKK
ncbi:MAG: type II toxin-antitoxin system prevent-host-death family antitoxin [Phyllobacteriaceae bacterium]|nr:type II toxin-antitoxin system prevent-host-death family antitoxin [Phyllobacteriaceae bacterium]